MNNNQIVFFRFLSLVLFTFDNPTSFFVSITSPDFFATEDTPDVVPPDAEALIKKPLQFSLKS